MKEGRTVSRRGQISKRDVLPDPLYSSKLVTKLVNNIMYDGKKASRRRSFMMRSPSSKPSSVRTRWKYSRKPLKTLCPFWKLRPVV